MGNFGPIVTKNYGSLFLRIQSRAFCKLSSMIGDNKNHFREIPKKNPFLGQMINFGLIVAENYASLFLRIHSKYFFQTLQDKGQYVNKNHLSKISKKILFWEKWTILTQLWPKLYKLLSQDLL